MSKTLTVGMKILLKRFLLVQESFVFGFDHQLAI